MNNQDIREKVQKEVMKWEDFQKFRELNIRLSPKAIDFLCSLVDNMETDSSQSWRIGEFNNSQEYAKQLIPNALNELLIRNRRLNRRNQEIVITTWEIWHSLSRLIDIFCFVPKNI